MRLSSLRSSAPRVAPASLLALAAALATGCASGGSSGREVINDPAAGTVSPTRIDGSPAGSAELRTVASTTGATAANLPVDEARAYAALAAAYDRFNLPVNVALSDARLYGVRNGRAPRRLNKQPLSRYLDCGVEAGGVAHADAWAVTITALSQVAPDGNGASTVSTQVSASARPVTTSGAAVTCTSTGELERGINGAATAGLGK